LPRAERAASILRAASHVFAHGGYAAASMDDIAAEAGVSKLMLYRHFNSKRELYEAILDEVGTRLEAIEHRPASLADVEPPDAVREASATLLATILVARELSDGYRLLHVHAAHEPEFAGRMHAIRDQGTARAERLLAPLIADLTVRRWAARLISALTDEAVLAWLDVGEPERDGYAAERLAQVLGSMLGPLVDAR
jgi:AcrR family transcriptional regulator